MICIPRVVPRYQASLKKFTSILSANTARLTMAKKKTSLTRWKQIAAMAPVMVKNGINAKATMCEGVMRLWQLFGAHVGCR